MQKFLLTCAILLLFFSLTVQAQKKSSSSDSADNQSQLVISAGVGNNPYKIENSKGNPSGGIYLKPGIAYYHKSGISLSAYSYTLLGSSSHGFFEFDVTPEYDFIEGDAFSFGVAYTRYFFNNNSSLQASPLKNDFYGYGTFNNWWIKPSLALDVETGTYVDTTGPAHSAGDVAVMLSFTHSFTFFSLPGQNDDLTILPAISLITGTDKFVRSFGSSRFIRPIKSPGRVIKKKSKETTLLKKKKKLVYTNTFTKQQAQFLPRILEGSVDLDYSVGNLTFEPQYYYDVPLTGSEKAAGYFLISVSYAF